MRIVAAVVVVGVVYGAIFLLIRANVRRLLAASPAERSRSARRQLILSTVAALVLCALALMLGSDDGDPSPGVIVLVAAVVVFLVAILFVARRNDRI